MFTYCGNISTGEKGYRGVVMHIGRRYRWNSYKRGQPDVALLLHSDDDSDPITDADLQAFSVDETIKKMFPRGFVAVPSDSVEGDWLLTTSAGYADLPDQAELDAPTLKILTDNNLTELDLRQRYNNCRSLIKAVGCKECPEKGLVCLSRGVPGNISSPMVSVEDAEETEFKDVLKNRETKVGAFTYISPTLTIPDDHHFVPSLRHYEDHDFSNIDTNSEKISKRNKKTAADRKFKKENCSVCPLQKACCAHRNCVGPYPLSDEITRMTLEKWRTRLEEPAPFKPWQFWALARLGGTPGTYRKTSNSRYSVALHGLTHTPRDGWHVVLWRSKSDIGHLTSIQDYGTLQGIFEGALPETEEDAVSRGLSRPSNDQSVALYLMLTDHERSLRHKGGWGGDYYGILYKALSESGVRIRFTGPRYVRYSATIDTYGAFFREITHRIGVTQIKKRSGYAND